VVNDGLGDDLRTAFQKVNGNFNDLSNTLSVTASNVGTQTGVGLFKQKVGSNLEFKSLVGVSPISIANNENTITISSTALPSFNSITTSNGSVSAAQYPNPTLQGDNNIRVTASMGVISIQSILDLRDILTAVDFGTINGVYESTVQFNTANINCDFGTITLPSSANLDLGVF
jgi:hypothetical protein